MSLFKSIVFFILLLSFYNSFSQSVSDLDKKNGFKEFHIGDDYSKWQSTLMSARTFDDGTKEYVYIGTCCQMVFQYPVEKILLHFKENKMTRIDIILVKFRKDYSETGVYITFRSDDFESIKSQFELLFGKVGAPIIDRENKFEISHVWIGEKIYLISTYHMYALEYGDRQTITLGLKSDLEDGF